MNKVVIIFNNSHTTCRVFQTILAYTFVCIIEDLHIFTLLLALSPSHRSVGPPEGFLSL